MRKIILIMLCLVLFFVSCSVQNVPNSSNVSLYIYVSKSGDDNNDGSKDKPLFSIHKAIQKAYQSLSSTNGNVEIYVEEGVYKVGDGLDSTGTLFITNYNISLKGGWNSDFSSVSSVSIIDLTNTSKQGMVIRNVNDIEISGFQILNGKTFSSQGGGMYLKSVSNILITNLLVSNNVSMGGGGMYVESMVNSKVYAVLVDNDAFGPGGGMFITNSSGNEFYISSFGNFSSSYGGGIHLVNSSNNLFDVILTNNQSSYGGGISVVGNRSKGNNISGNISLNSSSYGGGIYISSVGENNYFSGVIQGNSASLGGGVFIDSPQGQTIFSGAIITNTSSSGAKKSVIYLTNSSTNLVIHNCQIGGTTATTPYGIYEGSEIIAHSIVDSIFFTNTLSYIYHDPDGDIAITAIATLNSSSTLHDASASGNIASNQ